MYTLMQQLLIVEKSITGANMVRIESQQFYNFLKKNFMSFFDNSIDK